MSQDYLIGMQLDEYRLERLLGRGGMARVYRALDVNLNRYVAIKVIDIPHRAEEEYVQRFKREAQAIAQLDHPNIVRLYRFGEVKAGPHDDSVLYMAMQFIEGADLQFVLDSYRKDGEYIESKEARRIIREVCEALDYAHAKGIIHRDIKSSNIMLDKAGRAIVTDYGLAMLSTQATRGEIFGSPHYIAPEQAMSSAKAVPQSDLYAVGVILYEMFTGMLPFNAAEPLELALMHMTNPVPSPREIRPELSEELAEVMLKALEKRPEDRYPTGKALADALDEALLDKKPSIPSARMPIPDRVTLGLAGQSLPPLPPKAFTPPPKNAFIAETTPVQEAAPTAAIAQGYGTEARPVFPTVTPWQNTASSQPASPFSTPSHAQQPMRKEQKRLIWIAGGLAGLLFLFICLVLSGTIIYTQFIANPGKDAVAGSTIQKTPTRSTIKASTGSHNNQPTTAPDQGQDPTQAPEAQNTGPVTYQFQINRRGEDKGFFVITNTGTVDLPLSGLSIQAKKRQMAGYAWGVSQLAPGECLLARKEEKDDDERSNSINCSQVGSTVEIDKDLEDIFKDSLVVYYENQPVGSCEKEQQFCDFSITK